MTREFHRAERYSTSPAQGRDCSGGDRYTLLVMVVGVEVIAVAAGRRGRGGGVEGSKSGDAGDAGLVEDREAIQVMQWWWC